MEDNNEGENKDSEMLKPDFDWIWQDCTGKTAMQQNLTVNAFDCQ